ncbi:MAG: hypothetical protein M3Y06_03220, partial [Actinomycetota bacterium]|nr:hypothetical protein [Actinomycetota bacterium]
PVPARRAGSRAVTSLTGRAGRVGAAPCTDAVNPFVRGARASSVIVENSPHFGQRPYHLPLVAPQDEQRNVVLSFGTTQPRSGFEMSLTG